MEYKTVGNGQKTYPLLEIYVSMHQEKEKRICITNNGGDGLQEMIYRDGTGKGGK